MWHGHGADSCIAAWVSEELFEVVDLPDRNYTTIAACQQILTVTTEKHGLGNKKRRTRSLLTWEHLVWGFSIITVSTLTGRECCSFLTVKLAVCSSSTCSKRKQSLQRSHSTWNNMHKQSPNRAGDLGPVYVLCQSKAARSCGLTKEPRSVCQPQGLSVNRPWLATKMAPHSEARWFTRLICFSCKL